MDKKIKPHRHLPSKTPHPKFQCCTKLYLTSSAFRVWFFVHRTQPRSPKTTLKFGGAGVDNNTARVWFHRPSTVRGRGCSLEHIDLSRHFSDRCTIWTLQCTNPCVFILPNSKLYFLFYYLFYSYGPLPVISTYNPIYNMPNSTYFQL